MRSRKKRGPTKYICEGWKTCQYASMGVKAYGRHCMWAEPYVAPAYKASGYYCDKCNGIKITPEIELQIKISLL